MLYLKYNAGSILIWHVIVPISYPHGNNVKKLQFISTIGHIFPDASQRYSEPAQRAKLSIKERVITVDRHRCHTKDTHGSRPAQLYQPDASLSWCTASPSSAFARASLFSSSLCSACSLSPNPVGCTHTHWHTQAVRERVHIISALEASSFSRAFWHRDPEETEIPNRHTRALS